VRPWGVKDSWQPIWLSGIRLLISVDMDGKYGLRKRSGRKVLGQNGTGGNGDESSFF